MKVDYQTMLELIKQNVHEVDAAAQVWLYGSRARGEAHDDSDWDVLVLSPKEKLTFKEEEQFMDHICDAVSYTHLGLVGSEMCIRDRLLRQGKQFNCLLMV